MRPRIQAAFQSRASRSFASGPFQYFAAACVVLCLALTAYATVAYNFAGSYRILQVTKLDTRQGAKQAANVQLKLSLRVINYSGTDVSNATVSLKSSLPHPGSDLRAPAREAAAASQHPVPLDPETAWEKKQPTFKGLTLHFNEHKFVRPLEATFTVPAREYEQWMKGMRPNFVIEFQDAAGKTLRLPIQLTRMP
jgi:hypothetical protein